jgi:hypothetical protein
MVIEHYGRIIPFVTIKTEMFPNRLFDLFLDKYGE